MEPNVRLIHKPLIFKDERIDLMLPAGLTVLEMMEIAGLDLVLDYVVLIDETPIERSAWDVERPKAGQNVSICLPPQESGSKVGRTLFTIATIAASIVATAYGGPLAGAAVYAGLSVVGSLIFNSLAPPPSSFGFDRQPSFSISGARNRSNPNGVIPFVAGKIRMFPVNWAQQITEFRGGEEYLHLLLSCGYGPLNITDIKIGETAIDNFDDVQYEVRQGRPTDNAITLYPSGDVTEDDVGTLLEFGAAPTVRTTATDIDEFIVEYVFPRGQYHAGSKSGKPDWQTVSFKVEYRLLPSGTFQELTTVTQRRKQVEVVRSHVRKAGLAKGQYEVRLTRLTDSGEKDIDDLYWSQLRSIDHSVSSVGRDDISLIAISIKASEQLSNVVDNINCVASRIALDWDSGSGQWIERETAHPSAMFRAVAQHAANRRAIADSRLDLAKLQLWKETKPNLEMNGVWDTPGTVVDRLRACAAAGEASYQGGVKYGVIIDQEQTVPVQMFTDHNCRNFRGSKQFKDVPHAIEMLFFNEDADFKEDKRIVYDDGFSSSNATVIETLDYKESFITDPDQIWKIGRKYLATLRLRPEVYELEASWEYLRVVRGDMCRVKHDVISVGQITPRIKSVQTNGSGDVTGVTLEGPVTMEAGNEYRLAIRLIDDAGNDQFITRDVLFNEGYHSELVFVTPIPVASTQKPYPDNLVAFGERGVETRDFVCMGIRPGEDLSATLTFVDHSPAIYNADQGAIPSFNPGVTLPPDINLLAPAVPIIEHIRVQSITLQREPQDLDLVEIWIILKRPMAKRPAPEWYQIESRIQGTARWSTDTRDADHPELSIVKPRGQIYEIRVRSVSKEVQASDWSNTITIDATTPLVSVIDTSFISGLEIVNQGNDTTFTGQNVKIVWRLNSLLGSHELGDEPVEIGADAGYLDPTFAYYEVTVKDTAGNRRRIETPRQPEYSYLFDENVLDGAGMPIRDISFEVRIVDTFGRRSNPANLTVSNPAPEQPQNLAISSAGTTLFVQADEPADRDLVGMLVWGKLNQDPQLTDDNLLARVRGSYSAIKVLAGSMHLRVAFYDQFSDDPASLNVSPERTESIITAETPLLEFVYDPPFDFITDNPNPDEVSWNGSSVTIYQDGQADGPYVISAGSAAWGGAGTVLYIYYIRGQGQLQTTNDPTVAYADLTHDVLAAYRGGSDLRSLNRLLTASDLVATRAIITQSAQLASALINDAHINNLSATKLLADTILTNRIYVGASLGQRVEIRGDFPGLWVLGAADQNLVRVGLIGTGGGGTTSGLVVWNAAGTQQVFRSTADGITRMTGAIIDNATIGTLKVLDQAITIGGTDFDATQLRVRGNSGQQTSSSVTITTISGQRVVAHMVMFVQQIVTLGTVSELDVDIRFYRDSTLLRDSKLFDGGVSADGGKRTSALFSDIPGAGTFTYSIRIEVVNSSHADDFIDLIERNMTVDQFKR